MKFEIKLYTVKQNVFLKQVGQMASLWWVSPGAAIEGVTPIFS